MYKYSRFSYCTYTDNIGSRILEKVDHFVDYWSKRNGRSEHLLDEKRCLFFVIGKNAIDDQLATNSIKVSIIFISL